MRPHRSHLVFSGSRGRPLTAMPRPLTSTALSELAIGSCATLASLDLPEEIQSQLMHLGFVPESRVLALRRAPAGDPTVYCVDGAEVALRNEPLQSRRRRCRRVRPSPGRKEERCGCTDWPSEFGQIDPL